MYTMIYNSSAIAEKLINIHIVIFSNHTTLLQLLTPRFSRVYSDRTVVIQCSYSDHTTLLQSQRSCQYTKYTTLLQLASTRNTIKYHDQTNFLQPYTIAKRLITHLLTLHFSHAYKQRKLRYS